jgi:hypothetical protein
MTTFVRTDLNLFGLIPPDNITTHLRRCAADLLGLFQHWSSKEKPGYWFKARIKDLMEYLGGLYGKSSVSKAAKLLDELGVIKRHNHTEDLQIHTYYYEFIAQGLERLYSNQTSQGQPETPQVRVEASDVQVEASTLYTDPQDFDQSSSDPPLNECVGEEEMGEEEIQAVISASLGITFEIAVEQPPEPKEEPVSLEKPTNSKHDLTPFFNRLRAIDISLTRQIRELLTKHPEERLCKNITALEEEAAKNGLKNPIASCIAAITRNWIPKLDPQTWWDVAAKNWGRERRDTLIQNVTWLSISPGQQEIFIIYNTGKMLKLRDAYGMNWDEIANYGRAE